MLDWLPWILSIAGVLGVGGVLILLGLWPVVSSFLVGTRLGRWISAAAAFALAMWWLWISGKQTGRKAERAKQKAREYKTAQERVKSDREISHLPRSERRKRLERWVREP